MKTLIKPLFLAFSLAVMPSIATLSVAKPIVRPTVVASYKTGIYTSKDGKLNVAVDKQLGGAVELRLKNNADKIIYNQRVGKHTSQSRTRIDMSDLSDGIYQLEITNGIETTTHTITISTQQPVSPSRFVAINQ